MTVYTVERLLPECVGKITLGRGLHKRRDVEVCIEEAVAWAAGEAHSDHPSCVAPTINSFAMRINDGIGTNEERDRLLKPTIWLQIGTNTGQREHEQMRAWMAANWAVRHVVPALFDLVPALSEAGRVLRALTPLTNGEHYEAARETIQQTKLAAYAAAASASDAAAADDAAAAAAYAAADAAAYAAYAAADAAAAAAYNAHDAINAAYDAINAAYDAVDAAYATADVNRTFARTFASINKELLESAVDLLIRMCGVGRDERSVP